MTPDAHPFLANCGLLDGALAAWAGQPHWHLLDTCFGDGAVFLTTWQAWRQDPQRPRLLHYSALMADAPAPAQIRQLAQHHPDLATEAAALVSQWQGLLPGVHRLVFEQGQVLLTLHIGPVHTLLPTLDAAVDCFFLHGDGLDGPQCKALGRLARPLARFCARPATEAWRHGVRSAGFEVDPAANTPPAWHGRYAPRWQPGLGHRAAACAGPSTAVVVGAGLAGAAVAHSLARRGWQVQLLDAAEQPAAGASGLPAGLVAPHVSPDDAPLSRLSRSGVRLTLQRAADLLQAGTDWAPSGVLEHRAQGARALPDHPAWQRWGSDWSRPATTAECAAAGLPADAAALWHAQAGWVRPARLVQAQIDHPGVRWLGAMPVARLAQSADGWALFAADGRLLAEAGLLVLAGGWPTGSLLQGLGPHGLPLHPLRGQVSWGPLALLSAAQRAALPPFPVNGHGALLHGMAGPDGQPAWLVGSTFERGATEAALKADDQHANLAKLAGLLPTVARALAPSWPQARAWAGVRATLPDRLPAVGPLDAQRWPGLQVCTGLGARGLTLSVLCGEVLAARLHGEPWPTERPLALALQADRFSRRSAP